jgi:hypothetical protein
MRFLKPLTKTSRSQPLTHTVNSSSPQRVISYPFLHSKLRRNFWCDINIEIEKITLSKKFGKIK